MPICIFVADVVIIGLEYWFQLFVKRMFESQKSAFSKPFSVFLSFPGITKPPGISNRQDARVYSVPGMLIH